MIVFNNYSQYYDLLYSDKDYELETKYITDIIYKYNADSKKVLELGCGTGKHAEIMAQNFEIHAIDISKEMLQQIQDNKNYSLTFNCGDVRNYRIDKKFDIVISLFHIASYQNNNQDLLDYFETARVHLNVGGIFIFDCWYGPAVLEQKPSKRTKKIENQNLVITRKANPNCKINNNIVEVNYDIEVLNKLDNTIANIKETHCMRYLFKPEVEFLIEKKFKILAFKQWLTDKKPSSKSWSVYFILQAI